MGEEEEQQHSDQSVGSVRGFKEENAVDPLAQTFR